MNQKLEDLMYQSGLTAQGCWDSFDEYDRAAIIKFAQLIIQEYSNKPSAPQPEQVKGVLFRWPPKACPCGDGAHGACLLAGCRWERDPSLVPQHLRLWNAASQAEPVAWRYGASYWGSKDGVPFALQHLVVPLYAAPPAAPQGEPVAIVCESPQTLAINGGAIVRWATPLTDALPPGTKLYAAPSGINKP